MATVPDPEGRLPGARELLPGSVATYLEMGQQPECLRDQPCAILGGREFQRTETALEIKYPVGWADLLTSAGGPSESQGSRVLCAPGNPDCLHPSSIARCLPGLQALESSLAAPARFHASPPPPRKDRKQEKESVLKLLSSPSSQVIDEFGETYGAEVLPMPDLSLGENRSFPEFASASVLVCNICAPKKGEHPKVPPLFMEKQANLQLSGGC